MTRLAELLWNVTLETKYPDLFKKFKDAKTNRNSMESYLYAFDKIIKLAFNGKRPDGKILHGSIRKVMQSITNSDMPLTSQKTALNGYRACLAILGFDMTEWNKEFNTLAKVVDESRELAKANPVETENHLSMKELEDLRDSIEKSRTAEFSKFDVQYVLLCLYTMMPPLRSQDYCNSNLYYNSDEVDEKGTNYLCLTKKVLQLNDHKTVATHGPRTVAIPSQLIKVLKEFKKKSESKWVICTVKKEQFTHCNFTHFFNATTGKKISSSMIRKIYLSEKNDGDFQAEARKETAKIMGHTCFTAMTKYTKFSTRLHGKPVTITVEPDQVQEKINCLAGDVKDDEKEKHLKELYEMLKKKFN